MDDQTDLIGEVIKNAAAFMVLGVAAAPFVIVGVCKAVVWFFRTFGECSF